MFSYTTDNVWKSFKAIGLMICLVGVTKNCELCSFTDTFIIFFKISYK